MQKSLSLLGLLLVFGIFIGFSSFKYSLNVGNNDPDIQECQEILNNILEAKGVLNIPIFKFSEKKTMGAWADYRVNEIGMDRDAFNVCKSFGDRRKDAIAALLSHEVIHYQEKHSWESSFAAEFRRTGIERAMNQRANVKANEVEADYLGGFLAYSAGYDIRGVMPKLIDRMYREYELGDTLKNYVVKDERKKLAYEAEEKLEVMINAFEMGNYLTALTEYEDAYGYYQFLLKQNYESREVLNNLGVLATLSALDYFTYHTKDKKAELPPFVFPLQLDSEPNLGTRGTLSKKEKKQKRERLLREAIQYFQKASMSDSRYPVALLNEGVAHLLLAISMKKELTSDQLTDRFEIARDNADFAIRKAKRNARYEKTVGDAYILLGLLDFFQHSDKKRAQKFFKEASKTKAGRLASINAAVMAGDFPKPTTFPRDCNLPVEQIAGVSLSKKQLKNSNQIKEVYDARRDRYRTELSLYWTQEEKTKVLGNILLDKRGNPVMPILASIYWAGKDFKGESKYGLEIGLPFEKIKEKLEKPRVRKMELVNGRYLVYHCPKVILQLDAEDKLVGWGAYDHNKRTAE